MKKISILGSTGSIGTQALDVIDQNRDEFEVKALVCGRRVEKMADQIRRFRPDLAVCADADGALKLSREFPDLEIMYGTEGVIAAACCDSYMVLNSLMGIKGLEPTYRAVLCGRDIALANKETLVAGGELIIKAVAEKGIRLLPVDSEHSAIFQALQGNSVNPIKRIILTASGGPFRGFSMEQLENVTYEQAMAHPKWNMGPKITVDSATMMNKDLEVIEAKWLFDVPLSDIQIVVHPQSIMHSAVEFMDTSVMAQMGLPDMRVPISYALRWPERNENDTFESLSFFDAASSLTFEKPDTEVFRCIDIALTSSEKGGLYPAAMNGANEVLVQSFLEGRIRFIDIQRRLEDVMERVYADSRFSVSGDITLDDILNADSMAREMAEVK